MSKDPAFLFYPNDYLGGTMGMTFEEKGAYIELLMLQFNRGHMTSDMIGHTVGQLWVKIQDKFKKDDKGLFYNERLETEKNRRKSYAESRRNNLKGKNQYSERGHMTEHMETVDVNVNKDKDNKLIKDKYTINNICIESFEKIAKHEEIKKVIHRVEPKMRWVISKYLNKRYPEDGEKVYKKALKDA